MQREIKFRAWDKEDKWMYYSGIDGRWSVTPDGLQCRYCDNIMQYTGVKDINGKDIYEGDIVRLYKLYYFDKETGKPILKPTEQISFIEYRHNGFWVSAEDFGWEGENLWDWEKLEVIGNVYENRKCYLRTRLRK